MLPLKGWANCNCGYSCFIIALTLVDVKDGSINVIYYQFLAFFELIGCYTLYQQHLSRLIFFNQFDGVYFNKYFNIESIIKILHLLRLKYKFLGKFPGHTVA